MGPQAQVVAEPLAHMFSRPRKRGARDHEGAFTRTTGEKGIVRCYGHHLTIDVVCIVLG